MNAKDVNLKCMGKDLGTMRTKVLYSSGRIKKHGLNLYGMLLVGSPE